MNSQSVFYSYLNGETLGPFLVNQFVEKLRSGDLVASALFSVDGRPWAHLQDLPEYAELTAMMNRNGTMVEDMSEEEPIIPVIVNNDEDVEESEEDEDDLNFLDDDGDTSPIVACPHCWHSFRFSKINYISMHPSLVGDSVLGGEAQTRFLPMKFNADGMPLDARGLVCNEMACPRCHLQIPAALFQDGGTILSTVGAPSSGKSYYLTAMIYQAKHTLLKFGYSLNDADTMMNMVLTGYEGVLFRNVRHDKYVSLPKTELQGSEFSTQVTLNGLTIDLPLPFVYSLEGENGKNRNLIFYDNAGEHFEPGRDSVSNLATNHLVKSEAIFFLFDPFKDSELVENCDERDPQAKEFLRSVNQHQILQEMVLRIRKKTGMKQDKKLPIPLVLIVPKFDAWKQNFTLDLEDVPYLATCDDGRVYLNATNVLLVSFALRQWLCARLAEVVSLCEKSFETVYYVPVSALGRIPEMDEEKHVLGVKPDHLKPFWCEVPLLLYCWHAGLIPASKISYGDQVNDVSSLCKWGDNEMLFIAPGQESAEKIPKIFWGQEVYDATLGLIRFPSIPKEMKKAVEVENKDFWGE